MSAPRYVLDACVLYPTVLREILLGCAAGGLFAPLWSPRLLEEWARTALKQGGPSDELLARGEIARLRAAFPEAEIRHEAEEEAPLWLPDPGDIHVLATARAGGAQAIVTLNMRDFPSRELAGFDLIALHPDTLLLNALESDAGTVRAAVTATHAEAERLAGEDLPLRALLKRARLPRLAKAMART
ncbi:PIN domain-containing protein [Maritalea mobilis]|uniref:RSP_2648 family PIN domain-containing protein n=1 Tax=Maritalea mobilis TaxID=483324 RepID=UPI001C973BE2|nr:PIN domain-containing protein [Maritalea mobilis]MBY6200756.1 PIN domain-containing protein [Maritalea mobilis]